MGDSRQSAIRLAIGLGCVSVGLVFSLGTVFIAYSFNVNAKAKVPAETKSRMSTPYIALSKVDSLEGWVSTKEYVKSAKEDLVKYMDISKTVANRYENVVGYPSMVNIGELPSYTFSIENGQAMLAYDFKGALIGVYTKSNDLLEKIEQTEFGGETVETHGLKHATTVETGWSLYLKKGYTLNEGWVSTLTVGNALSDTDISTLAKRYGLLPSALKVVYLLKSDWGTRNFDLENWVMSLYMGSSKYQGQMVYTASPEDFLGYLSLTEYDLSKSPDFVALTDANLNKKLDKTLYGDSKPVYDIDQMVNAINEGTVDDLKPIQHIALHKVNGYNSGDEQSATNLSSYYAVPYTLKSWSGVSHTYDNTIEPWWHFWDNGLEGVELRKFKKSNLPSDFNTTLAKAELVQYKLGSVSFDKVKTNGDLVRVDKDNLGYLFSYTGRFVGLVTKNKKYSNFFGDYTNVLNYGDSYLIVGGNTTGITKALWKVTLDKKAEVPDFLRGKKIRGLVMFGYLQKGYYLSQNGNLYDEIGTIYGGLVSKSKPNTENWVYIKIGGDIYWVQA